MTDKQTIEPCMGCSALECWGVVDCDVAQRVLALHKTLLEIKEIIHFNKTNRLSGGACISIEQILQKISECEGNDEL
jgi:hypothetical protein